MKRGGGGGGGGMEGRNKVGSCRHQRCCAMQKVNILCECLDAHVQETVTY